MIQAVALILLYTRIGLFLLYFLITLLLMFGPYLLGLCVESQKRSRFYLIFAGVHTFFVTFYFGLVGDFPLIPYVMHLYFNTCFFIQLNVLFYWRQLKPKWYLWTVCLPACWYLGWATLGSVISAPFLIVGKLALPVGLQDLLSAVRPDFLLFNLISFGLSLYAFYLSYANPKFCKEQVHVDLTLNRVDCGDEVKELDSRLEVHQDESKILRVFQLTDVHLGPFMSKQRLFSICEKIVHSQDIDLVVITGDMETFDTEEDMTGLAEALSPLKEISQKVVACLGNHDYEVYEKVKEAYRENNIRLLEDEEVIIPIARWTQLRGKTSEVQVVGALFSYDHNKAVRMTDNLFKNNPRISSDTPRIFLIHNPSMISAAPLADTCDIIFSGHLHGGQIGIKRMTFVKVIYKILKKLNREKRIFPFYPPDQGLYGRGMMRLYSHRGTGHYGYPLRLGIPSEQSLINLYF